MKIIAVEEHFQLPSHATRNPLVVERGRSRLKHDLVAEGLDLDASRLAHMDAAGITMQVLSSNGTQLMEASEAIPHAQAVNDASYAAIQRHPDRFTAFAALPTDDPAASVKELERAVNQLGFKGCMVAGHTRGSFLDDKRFWPIFECCEGLDVPFYLHPATPIPAGMKAYFEGFGDIATAPWGYAIDTGTHFLRLVFAGVFDAFPRLKLILGHFGESIPFWITRTNAHTIYNARKRGLKKEYKDYVRDHLWVTTSGHFYQPAFMCTMLAMGVEKIMFAVDWPYEDNHIAVDFLKNLPISETDRERVAHGNAEQILKIPA